MAENRAEFPRKVTAFTLNLGKLGLIRLIFDFFVSIEKAEYLESRNWLQTFCCFEILLLYWFPKGLLVMPKTPQTRKKPKNRSRKFVNFWVYIRIWDDLCFESNFKIVLFRCMLIFCSCGSRALAGCLCWIEPKHEKVTNKKNSVDLNDDFFV